MKPLLQVTRQEEEMSQKEEELKTAKDLAVKAEAELKDIAQKHSQVNDNRLPVFMTWLKGCLCRSPSLKPVVRAAAGRAHPAGDEAASRDRSVC